jgi:ribosomal-protein-alanine N-acetyltransferase
MRDVVIVPASEADIDAVCALEQEAFPSPWRREFFTSELHGMDRYCIVAKRDSKLVGYCFAMWFFDEMHVNKIAVVSSARREGIAEALMGDCIAFGKAHGVATLSLEVRQSNEGAQAFYRHLQFASRYIRPRYYPDGEAAVVMMKEL